MLKRTRQFIGILATFSKHNIQSMPKHFQYICGMYGLMPSMTGAEQSTIIHDNRKLL